MVTGTSPRLRIIGPGRAGTAMGRALEGAGWMVLDYLGRADDVSCAAEGADLLLIATPDAAIGPVAASVRPDPAAVVAHLSGLLGPDVLAPHGRRAAIHPLVAMPHGPEAVARLTPPGGAWFAVSGDPMALEVVRALGGRVLRVADENRAAYHAAAIMASNHLVALLGQVERVGGAAGVPLEAFLDLARAALDNVAALGPAAALTGPVARGDWATVAEHLQALPADERPAYQAMAAQAARLCGREVVPCP
jgi:predicted short-subunit dehydrogenase-like oxidoreductase (DUF2520 family)